MGGKNCPSVVILRFFAGVCFVLLAACAQNTVAKDINALVGSAVDLPCTVDTSQCGELHSVKWYRDTSRIYVYSQLGLISRAEGNATKRMSVDYHLNNTEALLKISKVELQDEASYKCEITYLEVRENCDVVQIIKLQTMVQPEPPRIISTLGGDPHQAITNTTFGPYDEGTEIELVCEASGGKPEPLVKWYNGSHEVKAQYSTITDSEGLSTGTAKLNIILGRGDLGARYECRVTSAALPEPMVSHLIMDVHVKPIFMKLEFQEHVVQGSYVLIICDVFGANPAAEVKWFNNSNLITNGILTVPEAMPISTTVKPDPQRNGTYVTKSQLQFIATRYDNAINFHCYAENPVILNQKDSSFHKQVFVQVKYPPVVTVSPENTTTNESSQDILIGCRFTANPMELKAVFWTKNGKNLTLTKDKYDGGTAGAPPLLIKNVTRDDMGEYTCTCMNDVGASESENVAYLNVQYPPSVEVIMDPPDPVRSVDGVNVTAMCSVISGNPPSLLKVRWFLGDELLKELPECNYTSNDVDGSGGLYCNVDPSILSLVTVDQSFAGNYTCQGMNIFDWGQMSDPTELTVYYPPGKAKLTYAPSKVIKRGQVVLQCTVEHTGRPKNLSYIWYRGKHIMSTATSSTLKINPVKLDTRNNFTCMAANKGGVGESDTVFIDVSAPPTFITSLKYQHVRSYQSNMSLTCRVECSPLCYITWYKGNEQIETRNNPLYDIKTTIRDANAKTGDFESIESTLIWNVDAWPTHPFAKTTPIANYMCASSSNGVGNGVNASVPVEVEYPPENLTVSSRAISVIERNVPHSVICTGKGFPDLKYTWRKETSDVVLVKTQKLTFKAVTREDSGSYICEASNIHGKAQTSMYLSVEYAPECVITRGEYKGSSALLCTVNAKPQEISFTWKIIHGTNDTNEEPLNAQQDGIKSFLVLESDVDSVRTYQCYANNSAGIGSPCEIDVTEVAATPWWHVSGSDNVLILVAIIAGIILCAIFVCIIIIIIICVCKRRRARNKLPNPSTTADRGRPGGPLNDGSMDPLTNPDKGFYENLPFHGMQTPPNKTNGATTAPSDTYIF